MICIECMQEKIEDEYFGVYFCSDSEESSYCICLTCIGHKKEYPTLKSIH